MKKTLVFALLIILGFAIVSALSLSTFGDVKVNGALNVTNNITVGLNSDVCIVSGNCLSAVGAGSGSYNVTYAAFAHNQTQAANKSIFETYDARWSSTYNSTYDGFAHNETDAIHTNTTFNLNTGPILNSTSYSYWNASGCFIIKAGATQVWMCP